ncbi:MAG: DUF4258 domain-containing protein [Alteromonadaceae bacterium]|nr:DUF4258 domain-containing protein [Alteromonadaceae bacterium]
MYCERFGLAVYVTRHARERMVQRNIDDSMLHDLLETGDVRFKDEVRAWVAKALPGRSDNLICAAVILEEALVVKTVMHHFEWQG